MEPSFDRIGRVFVAAITTRQHQAGYPAGAWTLENMLRTVEQAADAWAEKLPRSKAGGDA